MGWRRWWYNLKSAYPAYPPAYPAYPLHHNQHEVLIIDNFYVDPDYVRSLALSLDYNIKRGNFPGFSAYVSLDTTPIIELLSRLTGRALAAVNKFGNMYIFSTVCESASATSRLYPHPHTDGEKKDYDLFAGVIYLNPPEQCTGGTAFYQHNESGIIDFPKVFDDSVSHYVRKYNLKTIDQLYRHVTRLTAAHRRKIEKHQQTWSLLTDSNEEWTRIFLAEMKYNRCVMYRGSYFHHPVISEGYFGQTLTTKRLTQNFVLKSPWLDVSA